jgi:2-polyprenyl-3-methyl-5-hydroxy-6-metoxy-1,4-benzoquinol methylase
MDAEDWDERYRDRELVWSAEPNVFVAQEVATLAPLRALDLAAGEGRNAIWLAEQGWQVEAVEFSAVAIEKGRALAEQRGVEVTWTFADLTRAPRLEPAELVLLAYLQLHWRELREVLLLAAALVRPGGTVLVVAHARRNLTDGYGGPSDPAVLPEPEPVAAVLADAGLRVERAGEVVRVVETEEGSRQAIDVLVRAHRPSA